MGSAKVGFTSPAHKKNVGKVVLVKKLAHIDKNKPVASKFATSFTLSDKIYMRAYMKSSVMDQFLAEGVRCHTRGEKKQVFIMHVNGKPVAKQYGKEGVFYVDNLWGNRWSSWNTFRYQSAFTGKVGEKMSITDGFINKVAPHLKPGVNKLKLTVTAFCDSRSDAKRVWLSKPCATATFTIKASKRDLNKLVRGGGKMPKAKWRNKGLERKMKSAIKKYWHKEKILRVAITDGSWKIHRGYRRHVIKRTIHAAIGLKHKNNRCEVLSVQFKQEFVKGRYLKLKVVGRKGTYGEVPCSNL